MEAHRLVRGWACRCGFKNEAGHRKCRGCSKRKPARRGPKHARILNGDTYPLFVEVAQKVHGVTDESCCNHACGKPRGTTRHHRDHDHKTGQPRGILCWRCNNALVSWMTPEWLRGAADYLERAAAERG